MVHHQVLDLGGVGVEAAVDEHVLHPIGDVDVAALVHDPDVARVEPSVGVDRLCCLLGVVEIPLHHVVATDHDLAGFAAGKLASLWVVDLHLDVVDGAAARLRDDFGIVVVATHRGHTRRLGEAVAGDDLLEPETLAHLHDHFDRDGSGAGDGEPQRRQVPLIEILGVEDGLVDRRWPGQHRDPLLGDPLHHGWHIEDRVRDDRRPGHEAGEDAGVEPERMEERIDDQVAVLIHADHTRPREIGPTDGGVDEHGALRVACRSRGEHDVAEVVTGDRRRAGGTLVVAHLLGAGHEVGERRGALRHASSHHDDLRERVGNGRVAQFGHIVGVEEVGDGEEHFRRAVAEDVLGLTSLPARVDGYDHPAGDMHAERGDGPLPDVGCPHRHGVALLDAARHERSGRAVDLVAELDEAPTNVAVDHRLVVAEPGCRVVDQFRNRCPGCAAHGGRP